MIRALQRILSPSGFPSASGYHLFKDAYFGRDALEVAEDLLPIRPDIARAVIRQLAVMQGTATKATTEEEPGKIHHEFRALHLEGRAVGNESRAIFRRLAAHWELAPTPETLDALTSLTIYATVDATPLYVRLISSYCRLFGRALLDEEYLPHGARPGGRRHTIEDSVLRAVGWIVRSVERSPLGLLEFRRMTPHGHPFQAWKDGGVSYLHANATFANYNAPIASIEVQGLAYDALLAASSLLSRASDTERARWHELARRLRDSTLERFWMPDEQYFAMALDRDPATGDVRQVKTITSNPGALLDSGLFDRLPLDRRRSAVGAIVERLYSDEFVTSAGIRCTSVAHAHLLNYTAYQSSETVWHKETYDVARGFRRQGFPRLASDLETRLLNAVNVTGDATEFLYVLPDGRVDFDPYDRRTSEPAEEIHATNVPENDQAWTISAALAIKCRRGQRPRPEPIARWQRGIEDRKAREIPPARLLRSLEEIQRVRRQSGTFRVNRREGRRRERAFIAAHELGESRTEP
ncbi:MAG TPA: hypothetical protein VFB58_14440 [Chloroflexota bacterium]|nr:hypothetical protein [Chloroflexota bacterium]